MFNPQLKVIVFGICLMSGCMSTQVGRSVVTNSPPTQLPESDTRILVDLFRLGVMRIPIPVQGTTLRSVVSDARDQASVGGAIVVTHLVNSVSDENNPFSGGTREQLQIGQELIVLVRGGTRIIVPEMLVSGASIGSLRVLPGDMIFTIPLSFVSSVEQSSGSGSDAFAITLTGDQFDERLIQIEAADKLQQVLDFRGMWRTKKQWGQPPIFDSANLMPNVAVISRLVGDWNDVLIFPANITLASGTSYESDLMSKATLDLFNGVTFTPGDVVHLTRLENLPAVALGLMLPVPVRSTSAIAPQATDCKRNFDQAYGNAREKVPLLPASSPSVRQAKQRMGARLAGLLPGR